MALERGLGVGIQLDRTGFSVSYPEISNFMM